MTECVMSRDNFHKHMKDKARTWNPDKLDLGDNFAVFDFNYKYQANNAADNLEQYGKFYGYLFSQKDTLLSVINTSDVD